jgi:hypothetical protein
MLGLKVLFLSVPSSQSPPSEPPSPIVTLLHHVRTGFTLTERAVSIAYVLGQRTDPPSGGQSWIQSFCEKIESEVRKHDCCHIEDGIQEKTMQYHFLTQLALYHCCLRTKKYGINHEAKLASNTA